MPPTSSAQAKLEKLAKGVRTGGPGSVRRKVKVVSRGGGGATKLSAVLKKQQVQPMPGIEEVNMFMKSGQVLHFSKPKVQANYQANTFVVSGHRQECSIATLMPGILHQIDMQDMNMLKNFAAMMPQGGADDDVPALEGDFEAASK